MGRARVPTVCHHVVVLRKSKLFELLSRESAQLVRLRDLRRERSTASHDRPSDAGKFIRDGHSDDIGVPPSHQRREPGGRHPVAPTRPPQDCVSADDKQAPYLRVTSLADSAELLPPSSRELSRNKANPRCEVPHRHPRQSRTRHTFLRSEYGAARGTVS